MLLEKVFRKENKIDKLVRENEKIVVERQRVKDKQNETNSNIETKIKALEDLAFRNKQKADTKIANLTRKLDKNVEQIDLEAKYYNKVAKATKGE
jgi:hypothetical protein